MYTEVDIVGEYFLQYG